MTINTQSYKYNVLEKANEYQIPVYMAFVDYEKAFDTVIRDALWTKLVEMNISCKMLNMLVDN